MQASIVSSGKRQVMGPGGRGWVLGEGEHRITVFEFRGTGYPRKVKALVRLEV